MDWVTGKLTGNLRDPMVKMMAICRFSLRPILGMKMQFCLEDRFNDGVCASQNSVCGKDQFVSLTPLSSDPYITYMSRTRLQDIPTSDIAHLYLGAMAAKACPSQHGLQMAAKACPSQHGLQ